MPGRMPRATVARACRRSMHSSKTCLVDRTLPAIAARVIAAQTLHVSFAPAASIIEFAGEERLPPRKISRRLLRGFAAQEDTVKDAYVPCVHVGRHGHDCQEYRNTFGSVVSNADEEQGKQTSVQHGLLRGSHPRLEIQNRPRKHVRVEEQDNLEHPEDDDFSTMAPRHPLAYAEGRRRSGLAGGTGRPHVCGRVRCGVPVRRLPDSLLDGAQRMPHESPDQCQDESHADEEGRQHVRKRDVAEAIAEGEADKHQDHKNPRGRVDLDGVANSGLHVERKVLAEREFVVQELLEGLRDVR
mmetsp:Transcript_100816/g.323537  ORF Transcript_100816/g.323537 Transcript_100816/m.323537 type:complete len:299 (+) Transcript_100816:335-1231(+)